jgi:hypothetical protein
VGTWGGHIYVDANDKSLSFDSDCCLNRISLFTEYLCILEPPCAAQEQTQLVYGFFDVIDETIAYCLVLLDHSLNLIILDFSMYSCCIYRLSFVVGLPSLLLFDRM